MDIVGIEPYLGSSRVKGRCVYEQLVRSQLLFFCISDFPTATEQGRVGSSVALCQCQKDAT